MEKLKKVFKKRPFLYPWIIFFLLFIYLDIQNIRGIINDFSFLIVIFIPYFYVYIFKPYLFIKDKRKFSVKFHEADKWKWSIIIVISIGMPGVGFIAYNGMAGAAKKNATKVLHANIVEYIKQETKKCNSESTLIMEDKLNCVSLTSEKIISVMLKVNKIKEYVELNDYKNAYQHDSKPLRISTNNTLKRDVGFVNLSVSGTNVVVKSCHVTPCDIALNRQSETIEIK